MAFVFQSSFSSRLPEARWVPIPPPISRQKSSGPPGENFKIGNCPAPLLPENGRGVRKRPPKTVPATFPSSIHAALTERHHASPERKLQKLSRLCHAPGNLCAIAPSFTCCTWNFKPLLLGGENAVARVQTTGEHIGRAFASPHLELGFSPITIDPTKFH